MDAPPNLSFEVRRHPYLPIFQIGVSQLKSQGRMEEAKVFRDNVLNWGPQPDMQGHVLGRVHTTKCR